MVHAIFSAHILTGCYLLLSLSDKKGNNFYFFFSLLLGRREMMNLEFLVLGKLISKLKMNVWEFEIISFFLCLGSINWAI